MTKPYELINADCLDWLKAQPDDSVDLVFCSPPYEDARLYGIDFRLKGQQWVDWCFARYVECVRVCRGLVAWVVEGRTRNFQWSATPALLKADLHRAGIRLRHPCAFHRHGISGSGGPDYLRNDFELVVTASKGRLPWSDNTAMGWPCKYKTGGAMSYRTQDGRRRNHKTGKRLLGNNGRPEITNPGNVIRGNVGKGHMGSDLAHETEAPFPEWLAEFFVRSFCPPYGITLDPFCGSGTTCVVAQGWGRRSVGIDCRESQIELSAKRMRECFVFQEN